MLLFDAYRSEHVGCFAGRVKDNIGPMAEKMVVRTILQVITYSQLCCVALQFLNAVPVMF